MATSYCTILKLDNKEIAISFFTKLIASQILSPILECLSNSNLGELNGNMNWSDAITLGSTYGIEMKYRYNAKFVEIQYGGTLPDGVGFGEGTNGYEFPSMPEEFLPASNIRQPIFCPGNGNKLCIRIYPWATDKWSIAPGSMGLTSVPEYIAGTFVYARR